MKNVVTCLKYVVGTFRKQYACLRSKAEDNNSLHVRVVLPSRQQVETKGTEKNIGETSVKISN